MSEQATMLRPTGAAVTPPAVIDTARRRRLPRFNLEVRRDMPAWQQAVYLVAFVALGCLISGLILIEAGVPGADLVDQMVVQPLTDLDNLRSVLFSAAPLMLVGLAAAVAFRARFWNLGLEGQMIWGGIGATVVSLYGIGPEPARLVLMIVFAAVFAMAWIAVAALMKLKLGVNEIISTLLMNYIALNVLLHLLYGPWRDPGDGFPHSEAFRAFEKLGQIGWGLSAALPLALAAALLIWWLVGFTRFGFYLKFVHANARVAGAVGAPAVAVTLGAVLLSGALAGIGGFIVVSGQEGRLTQSFFQGYLFSGVLIAFLSRNNPLAAVVVSILVAMLFISGQSLQVFYQVPFSMVQLIEAIIVICVATSEFLIRHRIHRVR